jgi:hypothetical protein
MSAPAILHIDAQECLAAAHEPAVPARVTLDLAALARVVEREPFPLYPPHPLSAMELQLLESARACAADDPAMHPRRELVAAALREAAREQYWRDRAELEAAQVREQVRALRTARSELLGIVFELVAWAAVQLNCAPSAKDVLTRLRAMGTGLVPTDTSADHADRMDAAGAADGAGPASTRAEEGTMGAPAGLRGEERLGRVDVGRTHTSPVGAS